MAKITTQISASVFMKMIRSLNNDRRCYHLAQPGIVPPSQIVQSVKLNLFVDSQQKVHHVVLNDNGTWQVSTEIEV